tara:strand:+ start:6574 stop:6972 length:399 start_codon:yes stop_codon:yes gene_type:complete
VSIVKYINIESLGDHRGELISLESKENIPFDIKRVYYLFANKRNIDRGHHAHKKLKQVIFCIKGSCKINFDNSHSTQTILLSNYKRGVYVDSVIWRKMFDFSDDCILMVLADANYDEEDYIRSYDEFIEYMK